MSAPWWIVIAAGTSTRSVARRQPPQRGSGSDGRRVLSDTADGEGIRRVERVVVMSPEQLERHQVLVEHQPPQPVEVVVEAGQGGAVGHREHQVVRPGIRDRRRQLIVEFVVAQPEQLERGGDQRRGAERNPERDGCVTAQGTSAMGLKYRTVRASPERGVAKTVSEHPTSAAIACICPSSGKRSPIQTPAGLPPSGTS